MAIIRAWLWFLVGIGATVVIASVPAAALAQCSDRAPGNAACGCPCVRADCTVGCRTLKGCLECCRQYFGSDMPCVQICLSSMPSPSIDPPMVPTPEVPPVPQQ